VWIREISGHPRVQLRSLKLVSSVIIRCTPSVVRGQFQSISGGNDRRKKHQWWQRFRITVAVPSQSSDFSAGCRSSARKTLPYRSVTTEDFIHQSGLLYGSVRICTTNQVVHADPYGILTEKPCADPTCVNDSETSVQICDKSVTFL
jgi:hypothetical protein